MSTTVTASPQNEETDVFSVDIHPKHLDEILQIDVLPPLERDVALQVGSSPQIPTGPDRVPQGNAEPRATHLLHKRASRRKIGISSEDENEIRALEMDSKQAHFLVKPPKYPHSFFRVATQLLILPPSRPGIPHHRQCLTQRRRDHHSRI